MIDKNTLTKPINKKVLLCSSGMDSYIINTLEKPDVCLFIDSKSKYSGVEKEWLISKLNYTYKNLVILDDVLDLSMVELDNFIVPARNIYFATLATYYGDEIILGATYGDRSTDKDYVFEGMMNGLLNHIYSKTHWCEGRHINFNLKYKEWTKEDLIKQYIRIKGPDWMGIDHRKEIISGLLKESFSCYNPTKDSQQCNRCKPDLRKFLAILGATEIDTSDYYDISPREYFTPEVIQQWLDDLKIPVNRRGRESDETEAVLIKMLEGVY